VALHISCMLLLQLALWQIETYRLPLNPSHPSPTDTRTAGETRAICIVTRCHCTERGDVLMGVTLQRCRHVNVCVTFRFGLYKQWEVATLYRASSYSYTVQG
jgi:hypothetical protein